MGSLLSAKMEELFPGPEDTLGFEVEELTYGELLRVTRDKYGAVTPRLR